jgi:hypothetical protein
VREGTVPGLSPWLVDVCFLPCVSPYHFPSICVCLQVKLSLCWLDVLVQACNSSTREAETGG